MKLGHLVLSLLIMSTLLPVAKASTILVPTAERFTELAKTIAHVKVEEKESMWIDGRIVTKVTARVVEPIKGSRHTEVITFMLPGGKVGNFEAVSSGTPAVERDEELVVFLEDGNLGRRHLLGQSLGLYRLRFDKKLKQYMATRDISQLGLVAASPDVDINKLERVREIRLPELIAEIKGHMAKEENGGKK